MCVAFVPIQKRLHAWHAMPRRAKILVNILQHLSESGIGHAGTKVLRCFHHAIPRSTRRRQLFAFGGGKEIRHHETNVTWKQITSVRVFFLHMVYLYGEHFCELLQDNGLPAPGISVRWSLEQNITDHISLKASLESMDAGVGGVRRWSGGERAKDESRKPPPHRITELYSSAHLWLSFTG